MKYWLSLILLVSVVFAAQDPEQPRRHDKYADDPDSRCMRPEVVEFYGPDNPHLHPCNCHQTCVIPDDGEPYVQEDSTCEHFCSKSHCGCNEDSTACPAPMPGGGGETHEEAISPVEP